MSDSCPDGMDTNEIGEQDGAPVPRRVEQIARTYDVVATLDVLNGTADRPVRTGRCQWPSMGAIGLFRTSIRSREAGRDEGIDSNVAS